MRSILRTTRTIDRTTDDFGAVLSSAAGGDSASIGRLVAEFEPGLAAYARRRGVADPDGVVNVALSDAFRGLPNFRGDDRRSFRAYLFRILRCRIADEYRRSYAQPRAVVGLDTAAATGLVDEQSSTFDDRIVDQQLVDDILEQLTDEQREVLEMRVLTGLSIKETADRTGRSEVAVKAMQRRALRSLRSLVIAAAVLALGFLGVRLLVNANRPVTVVENAPADSIPDGFDGRSDEVIDDGGAPPLVVEADPGPGRIPGVTDLDVGSDDEPDPSHIGELPPEGLDGPDQSVDPATPGSEVESGDGASASDGPGDGDGNTVEGGSDGAAAVGGDRSPTAAASSTRSVPEAPADTPAGSGPPPLAVPVAPLPESLTRAPCTVITDGTPAVGEVAFVTYNFSGPHALFHKTSVDIIGPGRKSALLPGVGNPDSVKNGARFAFAIGGNMMWEKGFAVQTLLADGEIKTRCAISNRVAPPPCQVTADDDPAKGETASVAYRAVGPYSVLESQSTYVFGWQRKSVMKNGDAASLRDDVVRKFEVDGYMLKDDSFEVRTAFADGAAHAVCHIR